MLRLSFCIGFVLMLKGMQTSTEVLSARQNDSPLLESDGSQARRRWFLPSINWFTIREEGTTISEEPLTQSAGSKHISRTEITLPIVQEWTKRVGVAGNNAELLPCNGCPAASDISKMIRTFSELKRIGRASHAIFTIPVDFAVWTIGFIRWCMGVPPSIRPNAFHNSRSFPPGLYQEDSVVMLEITPPGSKMFHIQVFQELAGIEALLWQSRSMTLKSPQWVGLVSPQAYIRHRLHELQSFRQMRHVRQLMVLLALEVSPRFTAPDIGQREYAMHLFAPPEHLISFFEKVFSKSGAEEPEKIRRFKSQELLPLFSQHTESDLQDAAALFIELLILSLIQNVYQDGPEFYVETNSRSHARGIVQFVDEIVNFVQGTINEPITDPTASSSQVLQLALDITGTFQPTGPFRSLISGKNGQVLYTTFLETFDIFDLSRPRFGVFPGELLYEGERYAYAISEDETAIDNMLNPHTVISLDFATTSNAFGASSAFKYHWFCSKEDNYLTLYFAPDIEANYSIAPELCLLAPDIFIHCDERLDIAADDTLTPEIIYCRTVAASLSSSHPHTFRIIECTARGKSFMMFIMACFAEFWFYRFGEDEGRIKEKALLFLKGQTSLACAIAKANEVLKERFRNDLDGKFAVILT